MQERSWERLGAMSGLVSAVLLAAGIVVVPPMVGLDATSTTINQYLANNAMRVRISALLVTLAVLTFLWFVGHVRHVLQRAEGGVEAFSPVVFGAGVALSAVAMVAMVPAAALAFLAPSPGGMGADAAIRVLYGVHVVAGAAVELLVALFTGTAGAAMVRRELAGPWLGWLGLLVALIGLVGGITTYLGIGGGTFMLVMGYLTFAAFLVWVAVASAVMLYRPEVKRAPGAREVFAH